MIVIPGKVDVPTGTGTRQGAIRGSNGIAGRPGGGINPTKGRNLQN